MEEGCGARHDGHSSSASSDAPRGPQTLSDLGVDRTPRRDPRSQVACRRTTQHWARSARHSDTAPSPSEGHPLRRQYRISRAFGREIRVVGRVREFLKVFPSSSNRLRHRLARFPGSSTLRPRRSPRATPWTTSSAPCTIAPRRAPPRPSGSPRTPSAPHTRTSRRTRTPPRSPRGFCHPSSTNRQWTPSYQPFADSFAFVDRQVVLS